MMYLGAKREREDGILDVASYLTSILATRNDHYDFNNYLNPKKTRVFECKTCNRQFSSFQALGGHRASHKKSKTITEGNNNKKLEWGWAQQLHPISKPYKAHECSICGLEFPMGQALGGHMRKHRSAVVNACETETYPTLSLSSSSLSLSKSRPVAPIVKTGRILCLDLNLAPPGNNGLDFQLEKVFPLFH